MATIKYRGLIGEYGTVNIALTSTVNDLKTAIATDEGLTVTYYVVSKLGDPSATSSLTTGTATLSSVGVVENDTFISSPAKQSTKEARQLQKLYIAQHKRQGGKSGDNTKNYYRVSNTYDINALPTKYANNTIVDLNAQLLNKRPWVIAGAGSPSINSIQQAVNGGSLFNFDLHYDGNSTNSYIPSATDEGYISELIDISDVGGHNGIPNDNNSRPTFENTTPRNFRTYIEFDGDDQLKSSPIDQLDAATGFTVMVVAKLNGTTGTQTFLESDDGSIKLSANGTTISVGGAGGGATATNEADDLWNLHVLTFDGTASGNANRLKYRKNKLDVALTFSGTVGTTLVAGAKRITVGEDSSTPPLLGMTGAIGEVVVFSKTLNTTELTNAETYLYNKWFPQAPVPVLMGLKALGLTLNNKLDITKDDFSGVQTAIESAHVSFNVFAVVTDDANAELLNGVSSSSGHHYFNNEGFVYNSSSGVLSTGNGIEEFSGGTENSLAALDGNKWMAMAVYDGTTAGFKGIITWIFTDSTLNPSSLVNGSRNITNAASIFQHMPSGTHAQHHTVIIGTDGTIATSNTTGTTGWNFSNNQQATTNGYYQTNQFSNDDGFWATRLNTVIDANGDNDFKGSDGYGLGARNLGDTSSQLYWNGVDTGEDNYIGFVFTGDR